MPLATSFLMAIGVVQGAVLAISLLRIRPLNPVGYSHLLVGVAAVAAIIVEEWVVYHDAWRFAPHVLMSTAWAPFLFGPSVWLFVKSLERPVFRSVDLLHYAPAFVSFAYLTPYYLLSGAEKIALVEQASSISLDASILGLAKTISLYAYFIAVLRYLTRIRRTRQARQVRLINRFRIIVAAFLAGLTAIVAIFAAEHFLRALPVLSDLLSAVIASVFFYVLSLVAIADWREFALSSNLDDAASGRERAQPRNALLDEATTHSLFLQVTNAVCERELFKEQRLNVDRLATATGLAPHYLSYVINLRSGKTIQSWINGFRVEAAKKALLADSGRSVLEIGLDAGFNSKAAFNRAFKAETGQSPSEFRSKTSQNAK